MLFNDATPSSSASGFIHSVYHVTDSLDLTGGFRYTHDSMSYTYGRLNPYDVSQPAYTAAGEINGFTGRYSGSHPDYRADISYRWSPELMTYANVSTGFTQGGVNPRPFSQDQISSFAPETVTAYEIGFKSDLLQRRLRVNGAAYLNKYDNIVFYNTAPTPESPVNATPVNAGNANISGGELEIVALPIDSLQLNATESVTRFQFTKVGAAGAVLQDVTLSSQAPMVPKWKSSFGAQYAYHAGASGTITPRVDFSYQSFMYTDIQNYSYGRISAFGLLNGRLAWAAQDGKWEAALAVNNLTNRFYYVSKIDYPIGLTIGTPAPPRLWMLNLRRNFD